jgi:hypothetical protein
VAKAEEAALRASAAQILLRLEMTFIEGQMLVVMLNETASSMPDRAKSLYAVSGILLPKSGIKRKRHGSVTHGT